MEEVDRIQRKAELIIGVVAIILLMYGLTLLYDVGSELNGVSNESNISNVNGSPIPVEQNSEQKSSSNSVVVSKNVSYPENNNIKNISSIDQQPSKENPNGVI